MATTNKKTVREWLETLEEPYRSSAISQTNIKVKNNFAKSLGDALLMMFEWEESIEGNKYWESLYSSID